MTDPGDARGDDPAQRWANLSPSQRADIEARLRRLTPGDRRHSIGPRARPDRAPLSFAQAGLWFLDRLEPGHPVYNRSWGLRLTGRLEPPVLERALNQVIRRHEILRTTIIEQDGEPLQHIRAEWPLVLQTLDLAVLPDDQRYDQAVRSAVEEAHRPFDLSTDRAIRVKLYRLRETEHLLGICAHHSAFDAWSARVLTRELAACYQAALAGGDHDLDPLTVQYADYAEWQRRRLDGAYRESLLGYWRTQLENRLPEGRLPFVQPPSTEPSYAADTRSTQLPSDLIARLRHVGTQSDATLFMVLLAAFCLLLGRYREADEVVVGTPVAGRSLVETEGLIGLFLNTLVLRADLGGSPSFVELLRRVRGIALAAYAHQELPFEMLVEALRPERRPDQAPLVQVLFNLENLPLPPSAMGGVHFEEVEFDTGLSQYELNLGISERQDGLACSLRFRTDRYAPGAMERLLSHYRTLLEGIAEGPDRMIAGLPLLTGAERTRVLIDWNRTDADFPDDRCVHDLFDAAVERHPEAIAVVDESGETSYRRLHADSEHIARLVRERGIRPGAVVGVVGRRNAGMVTCMLGVMKAGAAYQALDPDYPAARLAFMLRDAGASLLLAPDRACGTDLDFGGPVLVVDRRAGTGPNEAGTPAAAISATSVAYVVYTSGSTGTPKGIPIPHRGVVNYLAFLTRTYHLDDSDVILQLASPSFDVSVREIFGPLSVGARVVLLRRGVARDPDGLLSAIAENRITCLLGVVPSLLNELSAAAARPGRPPTCLRLIMTTGEALRSGDLERAQAAFPEVRQFVNQYGPSEATMIATHYPVVAGRGRTGTGTVLIGRPIPNVRTYVLDRSLEPSPIGIPGEVFVGGVGVAPGYLNRPQETAERFLPDPFSGRPGDRLYRTGDRACLHDDGNLEFVGRVDLQVKIRGNRVELGEVENVLAEHASVRQAAVTAVDDPQGPTRLVAYVVPEPGDEVHPGTLRRFLQDRLPDFMIPSAFVAMQAMPLTPNGKVDRRSLPPPGADRPALETAYAPPRTVAERKLAEIWCALLGLQNIGIQDGFLELGGHSLLTVRAIALMRQAFGVEVDLKWFFEPDATVERMAARIEEMQRRRQS